MALASGWAVCTTEKLDEDGFLGSYRERTGDPALIDSIDVAGDTPSDVYERRLLTCKESKTQLEMHFLNCGTSAIVKALEQELRKSFGRDNE